MLSLLCTSVIGFASYSLQGMCPIDNFYSSLQSRIIYNSRLLTLSACEVRGVVMRPGCRGSGGSPQTWVISFRIFWFPTLWRVKSAMGGILWRLAPKIVCRFPPKLLPGPRWGAYPWPAPTWERTSRSRRFSLSISVRAPFTPNPGDATDFSRNNYSKGDLCAWIHWWVTLLFG